MRLSLIILFLGAGLLARAEGNLFPAGNFDWDPARCSVKGGAKDGKYGCGIFLDHDKPSQNFIFHYGDQFPNAAGCEPRISLDTEVVYRDARESVKLDFSRIDATKLHRVSFLLGPGLPMVKGRIYEAVIYVKADRPDLKLGSSLMGNYTLPGKARENGLYKFKEACASTFWTPLVAELRLGDVAAAGKLQSLAMDFGAPGVVWVGKVELREK